MNWNIWQKKKNYSEIHKYLNKHRKLSLLTDTVESNMLDQVWDVNFCCETFMAKHSSLFNTWKNEIILFIISTSYSCWHFRYCMCYIYTVLFDIMFLLISCYILEGRSPLCRDSQLIINVISDILGTSLKTHNWQRFSHSEIDDLAYISLILSILKNGSLSVHGLFHLV